MNGVPAEMMNDLFARHAETAEGREKLAQLGGDYIRDRLREESFLRQLIPAKTVTRDECQVSTHHDYLVKIVEIEPDSRAMTLSFRGQPRAVFITGKRTECAFFTISSEMYQKTEQELMAYTMPVTKIIEENSVKDMQEVEDREFTIHLDACVQGLQQEANAGVVTTLNMTAIVAGAVVEFSVIKGELARTAPTDDGVIRPIQRPDLINLFKLLDGNRLRSERFLITEVDWLDVLQWTVEDFGDKIQSETAVDGYKYNTLLGKAYVRTIKTDILRPGNVYSFTSPDFFGKFYILNQTKFYIDKVANTITFQSWEDVGMTLVNVAATRKLELYSGDATTIDLDGILSQVSPVAEEAIGAVNNRVEQGLVFPFVSSY